MKPQWKQKKHSGRIILRDTKDGAINEPFSHYEDSKVRFSLGSCDTDKYCIRLVSKEEICRLYKTLAHFEQMTWMQLIQLPRNKGMSIEKKDSPMHVMLKKKFPKADTFGHLRVDGTAHPFRIFAARANDLIYVLLFDREGSFQH
ncbi:MAG: hypothetical protein KBD00_00550 [Candidatus Peribacteraceae bacterium]|nr:hypothetical protein [Candidatus Peribacteraceae bacterium]